LTLDAAMTSLPDVPGRIRQAERMPWPCWCWTCRPRDARAGHGHLRAGRSLAP